MLKANRFQTAITVGEILIETGDVDSVLAIHRSTTES